MSERQDRSVGRPEPKLGAESSPLERQRLLRLGFYWGTLILLAFGACTIVFWAAASTTDVFRLSARELFLVRAIGLAALVLGAAGIFFIIGALRRVALPVEQMRESAERIAGGDYAARVDEQGPRELRALARAFNIMADRLAQDRAARRTLIGNIANELRTPLLMLKENIEGLLDGNFARDDAHLNLILGETIRLAHLVDEMRMLALAESGGLILQKEPVDLNTLVRETVALYHRDASAHNVALHAVLPDEPLVTEIDRGRIQEVLGNLIGDALRSNLKSDVRIELSALPLEDGTPAAEAQVEIAYRGTVIPAQEQAGYFDRFWRTEPVGDGAGRGALELAIAKLLVTAHGGAISVTSDVRRGTMIRFTLPLSVDSGA